jgi:5'-3' exonuclease
MTRDTWVSSDDKVMIQTVLRSVGIPVILAPGEAEKFCAYLTIHGHADFVFTSDSDAVCFGSAVVVDKFVGKTTVRSIELKDILKAIELPTESFIDFCIMCGCDYNTNIPGIGPAKSYPLIKKYLKIENIPGINTDCLKVDVCRRLFTHDDTVEVDPIELNPDALAKEGRPVLSSLGLEGHLPDLAQYVKADPQPSLVKKENDLFNLLTPS